MTFNCLNCKKIYKTKGGLTRHLNKCKNTDEKIESTEENIENIESIHEKVENTDEIEENTENTDEIEENTVKTITNNIINIQFNGYNGGDSIDFKNVKTRRMINKALKDSALKTMSKLPENFSIFMANNKEKYQILFDGERWFLGTQSFPLDNFC